MLKLCSKAAFVWRNISCNTQLMKVRRFGLEGKTGYEMLIITKDDKEKALKRVQDYFKGLSLMLLPDTKFPQIVENLPRTDIFKELEEFGIKTNQRALLLGNTFENAALALAKDNYKEDFTIESVEQKIREWNDAEKAKGKMQDIKAEKLEYFGRLLTSSFELHPHLFFLIDGVPRVSECPERFQGEQRKELHTLNSTVLCILGQKCAEVYEVHPLELLYLENKAEYKQMEETGTKVTLIRLLPEKIRSQTSLMFNMYMVMKKYLK